MHKSPILRAASLSPAKFGGLAASDGLTAAPEEPDRPDPQEGL